MKVKNEKLHWIKVWFFWQKNENNYIIGMKTVHDLHDRYLQIALDWIQEYKWDFSDVSKKELIKILEQTEQEFIQKIEWLPKERIQDKWNRKLLSMTELKYKLIQDIAIEVIWWTEKISSLRNMKQLVTYIAWGESEYITQELVENLNEAQKDIPLPDIQWSVEQIGEVILPPDILERIEKSFLWWQKDVKRRPAWFDKIGLVEQFLSEYLWRERSMFQWKTGILRSNQMRKVSYYHLYLSEINKTLLLNNQYGEWCFVLDGYFDMWEAKKSDIKWTEWVVVMSFYYDDLKKFLEKLRFFLDYVKREKIGKKSIKKKSIENNIIKELLTKEKIEKYFDNIWFEKLLKYTLKNIAKIEIWWNKIRKIATKYWFKSKYGLYIQSSKWFQEFIHFLFNKEFVYEELIKETIEEYFKEIWLDELMKYTYKDIAKIEIWWNKIVAIVKQYWFKSKYKLNIQTPIWFQEFISSLYKKNYI